MTETAIEPLERMKTFNLDILDTAALRLSQAGEIELGNHVVSATVLLADLRDQCREALEALEFADTNRTFQKQRAEKLEAALGKMTAAAKFAHTKLTSIPADRLALNSVAHQIVTARDALHVMVGPPLTDAQHRVLARMALLETGRVTFIIAENQEAVISLRTSGYITDIYESPNGAITSSITPEGRAVLAEMREPVDG